jgi:hypothetical protein
MSAATDSDEGSIFDSLDEGAIGEIIVSDKDSDSCLTRFLRVVLAIARHGRTGDMNSRRIDVRGPVRDFCSSQGPVISHKRGIMKRDRFQGCGLGPRYEWHLADWAFVVGAFRYPRQLFHARPGKVFASRMVSHGRG